MTTNIKDKLIQCDAANNPPATVEKGILNIDAHLQFEDQGVNHCVLRFPIDLKALRDGTLRMIPVLIPVGEEFKPIPDMGPEFDTLRDVMAEVERARAKFPEPKHLLAALTEEVGELAQAFMQEKPWAEVRGEAMQVACVAIRIMEEGDSMFPVGPKTIDELIEASSFGTPEAKAVRAKTPPGVVDEIMQRMKENDDG